MFIHIFTKDSSDKAEDSFVPFFAKYFQVLLSSASNFLRIVIDAEGFDRLENEEMFWYGLRHQVLARFYFLMQLANGFYATVGKLSY